MPNEWIAIAILAAALLWIAANLLLPNAMPYHVEVIECPICKRPDAPYRRPGDSICIDCTKSRAV